MNFAFVVDAFTPFEGQTQVRSALSAIRWHKTGLAAALVGAALASHAQGRTQIDVPVIDPVEMTYSAFDPTHTLISEHALLTALQHVAERATEFPMKTERQEYFDYTKGLRVGVDTSAHLLNLHYESLRRHGRDAPIGTERTFSIAVWRSDEAVRIWPRACWMAPARTPPSSMGNWTPIAKARLLSFRGKL